MKKKIGVALGIFLLLFSGSWYLDQKQMRPMNQVKTTETTENSQGIMNISNVKMNESPIFEGTSIKFSPREYIRIQQKEGQQGDEL